MRLMGKKMHLDNTAMQSRAFATLGVFSVCHLWTPRTNPDQRNQAISSPLGAGSLFCKISKLTNSPHSKTRASTQEEVGLKLETRWKVLRPPLAK